MDEISKSTLIQEIVLPKVITKKHVMISNFKNITCNKMIRPVESNLKNSSEILNFLLKSNILNNVNSVQIKTTKPIRLMRSSLDIFQDIYNDEVERINKKGIFNNTSSKPFDDNCLNKTFLSKLPTKEKSVQKDSTLPYNTLKNTNRTFDTIKLTKKQLIKDFSVDYSEGTGKNNYLRLERKRITNK